MALRWEGGEGVGVGEKKGSVGQGGWIFFFWGGGLNESNLF